MAAKSYKKKKRIRILPKTPYAVVILVMALIAAAFMAMLTVVNALPTDMVMPAVGILIGTLILTYILFMCRPRVLRILGILVAVLYLGVYGLGTYYLGNTYAAMNKLSESSETETRNDQGLDLTKDAFNIYITGIDQWESEKGYDLERSDVNMIVTVEPQTRRILLTSIPRDAYVPLHRTGTMDKLTHTGIYGVDETLNTVEDWLGVDLNYYVKMNFSAVVDIINAIGGVDVYSPKEFVPVKRSWYTVKKGWNHMNGKEALAFARERKAFNSEDSQRVENQQRVVDAILKKMMTSPALLTSYPDILKAASDNMSTNMSTDDMQTLVRMQLEDLGEWDIEMQKIEGEYDLDYVASLTQESRFQVYKTFPESEQKAKDKIAEVMNPSEEEINAILEAKEEENKEKSLMDFINSLRGKSGESGEDEAASEDDSGEKDAG